MGRTGFSVALERDANPAPLSQLREAVLEVLSQQWEDLLGEEHAAEAAGWVSQGGGSLLTIGDSDADENAPADELMFWFHRSVDWPMDRAEHYLTGALVVGRGDFGDALRRIGYRLTGEYPTRAMLLAEHGSLLGPEAREPLSEKECPVCVRVSDPEKYADPLPIPEVPPTTDRRRELEKLRVELHHADVIASNVSMWQDRAGSYSPPEEHAAQETDLAQAMRQRSVAKTALEELFARTRAEAPAEIEAWALAHEALVCWYLNDCAERGESDSTWAWSANQDRAAWAAVRAGGTPWVEERLSSTSIDRERYRRLFGIDPRTLERVD